MITVVVVIHLMVAMAMIGLILLQKTEGNASGGGLSAGANISSMMQPRARSNPLSRATVILGIAFFATSISLALLYKQNGRPAGLFEAPVTSGPQPKVNDIREPSSSDTAPPAATGAAPVAPAFNGQPAAPPAPPGAPAVPNN